MLGKVGAAIVVIHMEMIIIDGHKSIETFSDQTTRLTNGARIEEEGLATHWHQAHADAHTNKYPHQLPVPNNPTAASRN